MRASIIHSDCCQKLLSGRNRISSILCEAVMSLASSSMAFRCRSLMCESRVGPSALVSTKKLPDCLICNAAEKFRIALGDGAEVIVVDADGRASINTLVNDARGEIGSE